ncbi:MAG: phosphate transport system regulatory protein PhoU [Phormidesmis priestleyi]|uniref:Phosphate transport system regulatory protein PhoU n=1 Tax=Phormidesmis priestleyi TaxID=268141 RepID=A0A2W4XTC4_9CYAN|nr:MAG: phosphate transport system regulatory protein PhoU [Phormidesmis priestleyi]
MTDLTGDSASPLAKALPGTDQETASADFPVESSVVQREENSLARLDLQQHIAGPRPTRPNLDRQLIRIQHDVLKMGALVENSCLLAKAALCDRDLEAAKRIPIQDKQIDALYRQIEVDCTNLITLQAPVTQDLRLMSAFMQMVRDLERIGDYTKTISRSAIKLFPYPAHVCLADVGTMMDRCRSMVALCLRSLCELDPEAGRSIKHKDDVVDDDYERLYHQLISTPYSPSTSIEAIVLMVIVIRALERIADHATNVGKRVTYVVTGERF